MQTQPVPQKTSGLAIAALVLSLCFPVGLILALIALVKIGRDPTQKGKGLAIAAIVVSGLFLFCVPIQAAIAIPNFIKFQARSKQSECKAYLKSAFVAQQLFHSENEAFSEEVEALGFTTQPTNRYAYFFSGGEPKFTGEGANAAAPGRPERTDVFTAWQKVQEAGVTPGVEGQCPECQATVACATNLDSDAAYDVWSVSTGERTLPSGEHVPAGELFHHVDDSRE
jgi:type IV pilus assembly protein PilA